MTKTCRRRLALFLLFSIAAVAQEAKQIKLDVAVTDSSGHFVPGLQQQDFTLLDNKQGTRIESFRGATAVAVESQAVLVIDEVNTGFSGVAYLEAQVQNFLKQNGGKLPLPVTLVFFTDAGAKIGEAPSRDGNALIEQLKTDKNAQRSLRRSQGIYGAVERQELSVRTLRELAEHEAQIPGRKLVVWVSPGWPILSGPRVELSPKNQESLFRTAVAVSGEMRQANMTLYSIDPLGMSDAGGLRTSYYKEFLKGVKQPSKMNLGNLALQVLATQSGGRVLNSSNDLSSEISQCMSEGSASYELTFEEAEADGPDDYHAIEVKVDRSGLVARTRAGYYARPDKHSTHYLMQHG